MKNTLLTLSLIASFLAVIITIALTREEPPIAAAHKADGVVDDKVRMAADSATLYSEIQVSKSTENIHKVPGAPLVSHSKSTTETKWVQGPQATNSNALPPPSSPSVATFFPGTSSSGSPIKSSTAKTQGASQLPEVAVSEVSIPISAEETLPAVVAAATSPLSDSGAGDAASLNAQQSAQAQKILDEYLAGEAGGSQATQASSSQGGPENIWTRGPLTPAEIADEKFRAQFGEDAYLKWATEAARIRLENSSPQ